MGVAYVTFHTAGNRSTDEDSMPAVRLNDCVTEAVTTSGVSAKTTATSGAPKQSPTLLIDGGFCTIQAPDGANVWAVAGADPVAIVPTPGMSQPGFPVKAGQGQTFGINSNMKVALIEF